MMFRFKQKDKLLQKSVKKIFNIVMIWKMLKKISKYTKQKNDNSYSFLASIIYFIYESNFFLFAFFV